MILRRSLVDVLVEEKMEMEMCLCVHVEVLAATAAVRCRMERCDLMRNDRRLELVPKRMLFCYVTSDQCIVRTIVSLRRGGEDGRGGYLLLRCEAGISETLHQDRWDG